MIQPCGRPYHPSAPASPGLLANGQRDLLYAGRLLRRSPVFAATALLSIALGIGASTAVFSLIDQVLLRRLPVSEPERLVYFNWKGSTMSSGYGYDYLNSYPLCREGGDRESDGCIEAMNHQQRPAGFAK